MVKLSMTSDLDKIESPSSVTSVIDIVCWGLNKSVSDHFWNFSRIIYTTCSNTHSSWLKRGKYLFLSHFHPFYVLFLFEKKKEKLYLLRWHTYR